MLHIIMILPVKMINLSSLSTCLQTGRSYRQTSLMTLYCPMQSGQISAAGPSLLTVTVWAGLVQLVKQYMYAPRYDRMVSPRNITDIQIMIGNQCFFQKISTHLSNLLHRIINESQHLQILLGSFSSWGVSPKFLLTILTNNSVSSRSSTILLEGLLSSQ